MKAQSVCVHDWPMTLDWITLVCGVFVCSKDVCVCVKGEVDLLKRLCVTAGPPGSSV